MAFGRIGGDDSGNQPVDEGPAFDLKHANLAVVGRVLHVGAGQREVGRTLEIDRFLAAVPRQSGHADRLLHGASQAGRIGNLVDDADVLDVVARVDFEVDAVRYEISVA